MNQQASKGGSGEHQIVTPELILKQIKNELKSLSDALARLYIILPGGMTLTIPVYEKKLIVTLKPQDHQIGVLHITKPAMSLSTDLVIQMTPQEKGKNKK
jgi:hypothetical protein